MSEDNEDGFVPKTCRSFEEVEKKRLETLLAKMTTTRNQFHVIWNQPLRNIPFINLKFFLLVNWKSHHKLPVPKTEKITLLKIAESEIIRKIFKRLNCWHEIVRSWFGVPESSQTQGPSLMSSTVQISNQVPILM
jgi:hypothetical protein